MNKLAIVIVFVGGLGLAGPASAAVYCFDGAGRSLGSGFDRETPSYRQIELARRTGGHCRDLGRGHTIPQLEHQQPHYGDHYYRRQRYDYPYWRR
jgi:hypothetical protein